MLLSQNGRIGAAIQFFGPVVARDAESAVWAVSHPDGTTPCWPAGRLMVRSALVFQNGAGASDRLIGSSVNVDTVPATRCAPIPSDEN